MNKISFKSKTNPGNLQETVDWINNGLETGKDEDGREFDESFAGGCAMEILEEIVMNAEPLGFLDNKIVTRDSGRQMLIMGDSVNFIMTTNDGYVILCKQSRAVDEAESVTLGAFGGYVDPGEAPIETLYREMKEETNIDLEDVYDSRLALRDVDKPLSVSAGYTNEKNSIYIVELNMGIVETESKLKCNDANEAIDFEIVPLTDFVADEFGDKIDLLKLGVCRLSMQMNYYKNLAEKKEDVKS